jgi:hypothetical protein
MTDWERANLRPDLGELLDELLALKIAELFIELQNDEQTMIMSIYNTIKEQDVITRQRTYDLNQPLPNIRHVRVQRRREPRIQRQQIRPVLRDRAEELDNPLPAWFRVEDGKVDGELVEGGLGGRFGEGGEDGV